LRNGSPVLLFIHGGSLALAMNMLLNPLREVLFEALFLSHTWPCSKEIKKDCLGSPFKGGN